MTFHEGPPVQGSSLCETRKLELTRDGEKIEVVFEVHHSKTQGAPDQGTMTQTYIQIKLPNSSSLTLTPPIHTRFKVGLDALPTTRDKDEQFLQSLAKELIQDINGRAWSDVMTVNSEVKPSRLLGRYAVDLSV